MAAIRISAETRSRLASFGNKGDTYDDIINALVDYFETTKKVHDRLMTRRNLN